MKLHRILAFCLCATFVFRCNAAPESTGPALQFDQNEEGIYVTEGGRPVLFYQSRERSFDGKLARAGYVHPMYNLDGEIVTEDFPKDHRHHRGIFWAWHQIWLGDQRLGDPWTIEDFLWDVTKLRARHLGPSKLAVAATVDWLSPKWADSNDRPKPVIRETTQITIYQSAGDAQKIDFQIRLIALEEGVRIGGSEDSKGYGGFSTRFQLPKDVRFTSAGGIVEPQREAIQAGPWMDVCGTFGASGSRSGITILCHPSLPDFPQPWILRQQRSMQNPVYPGRDAVELSTTRPLNLLYRLVIHRGQPQPERISKWQSEFASSRINQPE